MLAYRSPTSAYKTAHASDEAALLAERGQIDNSHRMTDDILAYVFYEPCFSRDPVLRFITGKLMRLALSSHVKERPSWV
jgi:hypothetical protein